MMILYAPDKKRRAGFPLSDDHGWYKVISSEEFDGLAMGGCIEYKDGVYVVKKDYLKSQRRFFGFL